MAGKHYGAGYPEITAACGHKFNVTIPSTKNGQPGPKGKKIIADMQQNPCWECRNKDAE
jgi:hypothetical protein